MSKLTIVGGGLSGLVAAIIAAQRGTEVELFEARQSLGGRARTKSGDFRANIGAHAFWNDGESWKWLRERNLLAPAKRSPLTGSRFHYRDRIRQAPPRSFLKFLRLRGKEVPVDESFRAWVTREVDAQTAEALSNAAGEDGIAKLEKVADAAYPGWRDRTEWRRQQLMDGQVGAVDLPGHTWRDRPQIDQDNGVFLAGDWVAAPGLLSEVAFSSAVTAAEKAVDLLCSQSGRRGAAALARPNQSPLAILEPR
jgi:uncharacterized protein with NAD-binding domain and iron-sulfur cluster